MICPLELASDLSAWRVARVGDHAGMESYSRAATDQAMQVQAVILRAVAKKINWWPAAEIIGISDVPCVVGGRSIRSLAFVD